MNKVVVVPQNAKVVFAQNENKGTFFAGVLVKVTACMVKKLYAVMGEVPAREALDALTARNEEEAETAETAGNAENVLLPAAESVPAVNAIEAPAKAEETETAAEAEAEVKKPAVVKAPARKAKPAAKKLLRPSVPETGAEEN